MKSLTCFGSALSGPAVSSCTLVLFLGACAPYSSNEPMPEHNVYVNIPFDSTGCPQAPDPIDTDKGKRIVWQSVDATTNLNISEDYDIFFDPFVGRPQTSGKDGQLKSLPFNKDVPPTTGTGKVEYKYTIVGARCKDKPLDPRLWLRR